MNRHGIYIGNQCNRDLYLSPAPKQYEPERKKEKRRSVDFRVVHPTPHTTCSGDMPSGLESVGTK